MSTADKLLYLQGTKSAIKDAIVAKGVSVATGTTFRDYATKIGEITTGGGGSELADTWVRPAEWLALPDNIDGVQKVSILNAVFDTDSEFVALLCRGSYTVDWGDGVVEDFADNVKAEHKYDYADVDLNSDTVATFGYKQCIITITPQSGKDLTSISINQIHSSMRNNSIYDLVSGFLDIRINGLRCTSLAIGTASNSSSTNYVKHTMLEQCLIGEFGGTTLVYLFYDCYALQSVSIKDTSKVTFFTYMHYNNYSLQKMPTYTFGSAGVSVHSMFYNCYSLRETYPVVITITVSSRCIAMFSGCISLKYIDLTINSNINYSMQEIFNNCVSLENIVFKQTGTGKVTDLNSAFQGTRIKESLAIDTSLCTSFANAFQNCDRLTNLYEYNYASATTLTSMLGSCNSLKYVPNFNITASCTNLSSMCLNCWALEKAPTFTNSSGVTNISSMLQYCISLTTIPSYVFGNVTSGNAKNFISYCDSLQVMANISFGSVYTTNSDFLTHCFSLKRMLMPLRFTFSVANAKMSATALNEMYSILPTVTGQTVTVTGNYGVSGDDPTIATSKGWTVVG